MVTKRLQIEGMHCTRCSATVEKIFAKLDGIECRVILAENLGIFTFDPAVWNEKRIDKALRPYGFRLHREARVDGELVRLAVAWALTAPLLVLMVLMMAEVHLAPAWDWVQLALSTAVLVLLGTRFLVGAWGSLRQGKPGMDVLVILGVGVAYVYSVVLLARGESHLYFDTVGMLLTLISTGKYLEGRAKGKSASALRELLALQEDKSHRYLDGHLAWVPTAEVQVGEYVVVAEGQKIPLDGKVVEGSASVDQSMLTGEWLPVEVAEGAEVHAGTLVVEGHVRVLVTAAQSETYLASIIDRAYQIQQEKPRLIRLADKVSAWFVPFVLLVAAVCFCVSYWALELALDVAIRRAVAVLVISCPCSLGLAAPLSIMVGTGRALKLGILYNKSEIFERMRGLDVLCLDKTGTLSTGRLSVVAAETTAEWNDVAYTMEGISAHPIAKAICAFCEENGASLIPNADPTEIRGVGLVWGQYRMDKEGGTVRLWKDSAVVATWQVQDTLKEDAAQTVRALREEGLAVLMLTGDNAEVAHEVARALDMREDEVVAQVRPHDKLAVIERLQAQGKKVGFVGDGINDSLALEKADFSIAMGSGTDAAKVSADIIVEGESLGKIVSGIRLSRAVYRNIIQNFVWAFSYNLVAIPLAFMGILSPLVAGACMAFSNVTVVANALRLYRKKV